VKALVAVLTVPVLVGVHHLWEQRSRQQRCQEPDQVGEVG
jgi:hypothetical protein